MAEQSVTLETLFAGLQARLLAHLQTARSVHEHGPTKGGATEAGWTEMLRAALPGRYRVETGFAIDYLGGRTEQIDILVFDAQYSPVLFQEGAVFYVPAESIYAAFEVRQDVNRANLLYAAEKVASVRGLERTSAAIPHAGGVYEPKGLTRIIGGLLATEVEWAELDGEPMRSALRDAAADGRLELVCALHGGTVQVDDGSTRLTMSRPEHALSFLVMSLLAQLQAVGTVAAIDLAKWSERLTTD